MPGCKNCPFRYDPETDCSVLASGATQFCRKVDPDSGTYSPAMVGAVRRLTLEPLGRWEEPFPPLAEQAANLAGAVGRFVASGMKQSTPEQVAERLAICRGCSHFRDGRCSLCGCFLAAKLRSAAEKCPVSKW